MHRTTRLAALAALGLAGTSALLLQWKSDPVAESFERDFDRAPTPTAPIRRSDIDEDLLYQAINPIGWTQPDSQPLEDLPVDARETQ